MMLPWREDSQADDASRREDSLLFQADGAWNRLILPGGRIPYYSRLMVLPGGRIPRNDVPGCPKQRSSSSDFCLGITFKLPR